MTWSAAQYSKFEDERNRPIADLLARIPNTQAAVAADIGCGPGNSTELLCRRFPEAAVVGMDSSVDMITAAKKRLPAVAFEQADIAVWTPSRPFDVILANAVLQWLPNHAALFPALVAKLAPGGTLAVQMPDNLDQPAHILMRDTAAAGPWAAKLAQAAASRSAQQDAAWYYALLRNATARLDVWRTTYYHPLAGAGAVVEWFKGTGLRPYLDPLDADERAEYLTRYEAAVAKAYPALDDGTVLLPFPRLFILATR